MHICALIKLMGTLVCVCVCACVQYFKISVGNLQAIAKLSQNKISVLFILVSVMV